VQARAAGQVRLHRSEIGNRTPPATSHPVSAYSPNSPVGKLPPPPA
jgi:hypothetical protein